MTFAAHKDLALDACSHFSASPTPFHNVANLVARLEEAGYQKLEESENFTGKVKGNGLYYYTRNTSTLCAFAIGGKYDPTNGNGGFKIIGGHTDSPNLRIKVSNEWCNGARILTILVPVYLIFLN